MKIILTLILGVVQFPALGQDASQFDLQSFAEEFFQVQDEDLNYEDLYESLLQLYTSPLDLNTATVDDLVSLFILAPDQVNNLLDYRANKGQLISIYELQAIPGFDLALIRRLRPFVTVEEKKSDTRPLLQRIVEEKNKFLLIRMERTFEESEGFILDEIDSTSSLTPKYSGDRNKVYSRFRTSKSKDFSIGFTMEKDAGEQISFNNTLKRYGPDFLSYHVIIENQGNLKSLALGDYQIQFGQGLLLGAGFNLGKGSETITTVRRSSTGIRPYSSVLESGFFRGGAATYTLGHFDLTGFYSHQFVDANVQNDTTVTEFDDFISSIQATGLHRTETEQINKDQVREQVSGGNITYRSENRNASLGLSVVNTRYNVPIAKRPVSYNRFEFGGRQNFTGSLFSNFLWQNLNFFGEVAVSESGGIGAVGGLVASLSNRIAISLVLRNYDRNFHSFYGNSFGESSRNINEHGIYWGLKISPLKKFDVTAYYDRFKFPWLKFRAEGPSEGYEFLIRLNYSPASNINLFGQIRKESKERNSKSDDNLKTLSTGIKRNYLLNLDYHPNDIISLKSRLQWSEFNFEGVKTGGFAIIQDFNFKIRKIKLGTRFALFDGDDFENRQFAYEKDVLYAFSIPAYSGVGIRNYLLLQYTLNNRLTFWARLSRTTRQDSGEIGSGLDKINGNHKTDLKLQVRYNL